MNNDNDEGQAILYLSTVLIILMLITLSLSHLNSV